MIGQGGHSTYQLVNRLGIPHSPISIVSPNYDIYFEPPSSGSFASANRPSPCCRVAWLAVCPGLARLDRMA